MNWKILAVGKPKLAYAAMGMTEYLQRLQPLARVEFIAVKTSADLLKRSVGAWCVVLDERGTMLSSQGLAQLITTWELQNRKEVCLLIGAADGHDPALRAQADYLWSLSALTLPHELALVVVLEQIYRGYAIKTGHPYHRK
jgi:23S rRNA (pseudouridine1915-N3)-methyltransferase